jgi:hypothetical protein
MKELHFIQNIDRTDMKGWGLDGENLKKSFLLLEI